METKYDVIVIGAGAGGLVVAIGSARAGKRVLLVERGHWGGDCTNFGCIPSKTLIAGAERGDKPAHLLKHVRNVVSEVRSHEEPPALEKEGVVTAQDEAYFIDSHSLKVGDERVTAKNIVIATGSSPLIPSIEGLEGTPYLTNETVFALETLPKSLGVIGGGPIGCELAQAFGRLGTKVSQIHRHGNLLKREEPEAQQLISQIFAKERVHLCLNETPQSISYSGQEFVVKTERTEIRVEQLLVAVGRRPNIEKLNLDAAGIDYSQKGISIDKYGRTNKKHIWAIGDVTGGAQFTHMAENHGRAVLTSILLPFKKKFSRQAVPRATFTDPEIASFGLLTKEAEEKFGKENIAVYDVPMSQVDRAITAGRTEGFVKVVTRKMSSQILGATIVAPRAGEMLPELSLAALKKIPLRKLATLIHPYPTYNHAIRKASDQWLTQTLLPALKQPHKLIPWKRILPLLIIAILMIIAYSMGWHRYLSFSVLKEQHANLTAFVAAHPIATPLIYITMYTVSTALSLPGGAILSLIGGFLFPLPLSTIYVLIGATAGASLIFLAARTAVGDLLRKKAGPFLKKMEKGFQKDAWSYLLFLRFVPIFPFWLVNIAPAFFNIAFWTFVWTTFIGIIPGAFVFTQTGAGLGEIFASGESFSLESIFNIKLQIGLVALALFALIPTIIKKIVSKRKNS